MTPERWGSYTESVSFAPRRDAMRSAGLILVGAALFFFGLLIRTDLLESTLNVVGVLAMVVGVAVFAAGVFILVRDRI